MRKAKPIEELQKNVRFSPASENAFLQILPNSDGSLAIIEPGAADNITWQSRLISPNNQATKAAGKVFFSTSSGEAMCSASVVTAPSKSLVVTAAHCLFDDSTRTWYTNWIFVPVYDEGAAPLGRWVGRYGTILNAYAPSSASSKNYNYDVGFVVVSPVNARKIAQVTGSQGIKFNAPRNQMTFSFGYPGNIADGEIMSACISKTMANRCGAPSYVGQALRCAGNMLKINKANIFTQEAAAILIIE
ncbi:unnamed protein product [Rotaria sp. Silwood1]|nr:unnamed protein product [Rotaria sp. Silwood1]CAF4854711.1 unnamed protein product [Rotaria sp. Silwood1]